MDEGFPWDSRPVPPAFKRVDSGLAVWCQPDHCHLHGRELPYIFTTVDALVNDFIAAVDAARRTP
jgi:hypothetical protein